MSESPVAGLVTAAGLPFAAVRRTGWLWPPPPAPDLSAVPPQEAVTLRYRRALDTWLSEDLVGEAVEALLALAAEAGRPNVIAADPFLPAAALAAEALDVPLAVCGWPAQRPLDSERLFPVQQTLGADSRARIGRLLARFGLKGINFSTGPTPAVLSPRLHICYFTQSWYAADADSLLPHNLYVGGFPQPPAGDSPAWLADIPMETPLALVTLGSAFTGDLGFFSWAAQAAAQVGLLPVVVIGTNPIAPADKAALKAALPPGTRLLNWVDFDHLLPRVRLAVHHGGMGTTHAAVVHSVPQLVVPHAADQRAQARRVAQAKVGLHLTAHDVRNGALLQGARALLNDERVQANTRRLAAEMAALGGPPRAAAALAELAAG